MKHNIFSLHFLAPLGSDHVEHLIKNGDFAKMKYAKNNILHFEGEPCYKVEIILSGRVVIDRIDESGTLMGVAEFITGDLIGGNLIFSKNPVYPLTVTAREECEILQIKKDVLFELLVENSGFLKLFLEYISDHAFLLGDKIKHYVNRTIRESILSFLDYESKRQNSKTIKLNITKKNLAEKIGVQRTSLSRELNKMRNKGLIEYDAKEIIIKY